jgi:hypothetical protein
MQSRNLTILLILLIALSYTVWITPQAEKLNTTQSRLSSVENELNTLAQSRIAVSDSVVSDLEAALVETAVPEGFNQDDLIKSIRELAENFQINLVNISFTQSFAEQTNQIKTAQITLNANGSPAAVKAFLSALENSSRGFFVKNLGLNYGTVNEVAVGNLNITFEAYYT